MRLSVPSMVGLGFVVVAGPPAAAARARIPEPPGAHVIGPPPGHTGGFGEPTCRICHEGEALNAFGGRVSILGLPDQWVGGARYVLTVALEAPETSAAGFQLSARFAEGPDRGRAAGEFVALSPRVTVTSGETGQPYAHHTQDGSRPPDDTGSTWLVEWTAPAAGAPVVFHVAANSGNGDNSPLMDLIYVAERTVLGGGASDRPAGRKAGQDRPTSPTPGG